MQQQTSSVSHIFPFSPRVLIGYLTGLNCFVPLSIDLYLPALPDIGNAFGASASLSSMTMSIFMLFFGLSMLFWGAFSDRLGRKPILNIGLALYIVSALACAVAPNIYVLIIARALQATASGAISTVTMAIIRDVFTGRTMETVLVAVQTLTVICPMLAPLFGALMLTVIPWQGLFVVLACMGLLGFCMGLLLKESHFNRTDSTLFGSLRRIGIVLKHPGLRRLLFLFGLAAMPFMAYLTSSSFIYIKFFGLSQSEFSLFFGANACAAMIAPILYVRLLRKIPRRLYLSICYLSIATCGLVLYNFGESSPYAFLVSYMPITFFGSGSRPVGTILMMSQLNTDHGTVSALIGSSGMLFGSVAMLIASLEWSSPVMAVAIIAMAVGSICCAFWLRIDSRKAYTVPSHMAQ